jgi:excisionase family DNA binding protein
MHSIEPSRIELRTLSVDDVAKVLGVGRSAVYEAIHRGEIPALHFGRRIVVPRVALLRLLGEEDS